MPYTVARPLFLHIGRHKTGTTAIQRFLFQNRASLQHFGFLYPSSGLSPIAHHDIALYFSGATRKARATNHELERVNASFQALLSEIESSNCCPILSSEAFQNSVPKAIARAFKSWNVKVIVYLREQIEYLSSAYQQKIHATDYSHTLSEFSREFNPDYNSFLERWEESFGFENIKVRAYDKASLLKGDVISDVCAVAHLPYERFPQTPKNDPNPSIGGPLLEFKFLLNRLLGSAVNSRDLYSALGKLALERSLWRLRPLVELGALNDYRSRFVESNSLATGRHPSLSSILTPRERPSSPCGKVVDPTLFAEVGDALGSVRPSLHDELLAKSKAALALDYRKFGSSSETWIKILQSIPGTRNLYSSIT